MADLAGVALPDDVIWTDEFDWTPIGQSVEVDVTGGLVVEYAPGRSGRPITIRAEWIALSVLRDLEALRDAGVQNTMVLNLSGGRVYDVLFRHFEGPPLSVEPIVERPEYSESDGSPDFFNVMIRLMEV